MGCHGAHAFKHSQNKFFPGDNFLGACLGPNEQFDTHGILSWGSKIGQIRFHGTCNMILSAGFQRFFLIFRIFSPPPQKKKKKKKKKIPFPHGFFEDLPDT